MSGGGVRDASVLLGIDAEVRGRLDRLVPQAGPAQTGPTPGSGPAPDGSPEQAERLFARVVWSRLVEPGDAIAGALVGSIGAGRALGLVIGNAAPGRIGETVRETGGPELDPGAIAKALARWRPRLDRAASLGDLDRGIAAGMRVVTPESEQWPGALDDLGAHAPLLLWTRGDPAALPAFSVAVVGARACTGYGSSVTAELTEELSAAGAAIVSGAAYGIDAVAHRTALAVGAPTIAVLAGGADRAYPSAHGALLERIAGSGAVCSELVPGSAPTRWRFLQRNRIISALSRATLVTEAGVRSGSLNTAGHASELGRPLGAVPGPITSAASAGCHRLVRDYAAVLVTSGAEAREFAGLGDDPRLWDPEAGADGAGGGSGGSGGDPGSRQPALHRRVLDALPLRGARGLVDVARIAGVEVREARGALAELEALGTVARRETPDDPGEQWVLRRRE